MDKSKWQILKKEIAKEHSKIRKNPKSYIPLLEKNIKLFKGDILYKAAENIGIQTYEGKSAYLECIEFLKKQKPVGEVIFDEELSKAAQDHADDIGPAGICEHTGTDGSTMDQRVERYVDWDVSVSENIDFGAETAEEIIISLIVDDGISDRGHRKNIFKPDNKYIGVGIANHAEFRICTVIDYVGAISSYKNNNKNSSKKPQHQYHTVKGKDDDDEKIKKLKEMIVKNDKRNSAYDSNLNYDFDKKMKLNDDIKSHNNLKFPDDPDAPEEAIACQIKIITKTSGRTTEKKTIKTYTLKDGSQEIIELVEIFQ